MMVEESESCVPLLRGRTRYPRKPQGWVQQRYIFAFLSGLGFFNVYALRVNLSVAMVAMVNMTHNDGGNVSLNTECPSEHLGNATSDASLTGEFNWTPQEQGLVLSSFFYGYIVTQLPGGQLAEKIGGKWPFGVGVLATGVLTLLTPLAARSSLYLLVALRVLEGLFEGVTPPAFHSMAGRWAPPLERSRIVTAGFIGAQVGTVVAMPVSGWLANYAWPSVFYVFGAVACVWFILWSIFVHNSPSEHPRISEEEKTYILTLIGDFEKRGRSGTPWKSILTSAPVWSMALAHAGMSYLFYTLLTDLPTYMKNVLHFNINQNGLFSALPYLLYTVVGFIYSPFADWLFTKHNMSTLGVRKLSTAIGLFLPAIFLIGTAYIGCNYYLGVALLTLSVGSVATGLAGYISNVVDLSPTYAGSIMGVVSTCATVSGIVAPQVVGAITSENETQSQWRIIFYIAGGFCFLSGIPYMFLTKTDQAPWSYEGRQKHLTTQRRTSDTSTPTPNMTLKHKILPLATQSEFSRI